MTTRVQHEADHVTEMEHQARVPHSPDPPPHTISQQADSHRAVQHAADASPPTFPQHSSSSGSGLRAGSPANDVNTNDMQLSASQDQSAFPDPPRSCPPDHFDPLDAIDENAGVKTAPETVAMNMGSMAIDCQGEDEDAPRLKKQCVEDLSSSSDDKVVSQLQGDTLHYESAKSWLARQRDTRMQQWQEVLQTIGDNNPDLTVKDFTVLLSRNHALIQSLAQVSSSEEAIKLLSSSPEFAEQLRNFRGDCLFGTSSLT